MKKILSLFWGVLPHITLILSLMLLIFFAIDLCNESMAFLNNSMTKNLLAADALLTTVLSIQTVIKKETKPCRPENSKEDRKGDQNEI